MSHAHSPVRSMGPERWDVGSHWGPEWRQVLVPSRGHAGVLSHPPPCVIPAPRGTSIGICGKGGDRDQRVGVSHVLTGAQTEPRSSPGIEPAPFNAQSPENFS
ncbi:hypothetical protein KIL84_002443 [Mauremys mutica]|uniref:Uncharacterized protein n=1 Tax=Mauremys mutica TaxID=74926 RepID=A0A9D4AY86_9SAUR|nr:hypothetical protein KIL84_002443 [Mauremys mutica]